MSYLIYLYAAASCISIAATNGILAILTIIFLKRSYDARKMAGSAEDFRFFAGVYGWKAVTLVANGLWTKVYRIRELWDKMPCLVLSRAGVKKHTMETASHVLFATNSLLIVWAVMQKYFNCPFIYQPLTMPGNGRMLGYFGHPLHYGGYIAIVLLLALALTLFYRRRFGIYLPFLVAGLVISGSRSYFIGVSVAGLILMGLKSRKIALAFIVIAPLAALIVASTYPNFSERLSFASLHASFTMRAVFWSIAWKAFLENPFFGVGYEEFSNYLKPYAEQGLIDNHAHAHNLYLQELAAGGIVGGALIVATFIYFIRKYYLCFVQSEDALLKSLSIGLCSAYVCLSVAGLTEYNFGSAVVWLLLTFLMGLTASYKKEIESC